MTIDCINSSIGFIDYALPWSSLSLFCMKKIPVLLFFLVTAPLFALTSCFWTGWQMEYGKPAAQFYAADLGALGTPFIGKKITVKGTVTGHETTKEGEFVVILNGTIRCMRKLSTKYTESYRRRYKVGKTVFFDGFLRECKPSRVVINPSSGRDPSASFNPKK